MLPALLDVKLKLALVLLVRAGGVVVRLVCGAWLITVQLYWTGVETLTAGSMARTSKLWLPSDRLL